MTEYEAKKLGIKVIAFTSMEYTKAVDAVHPWRHTGCRTARPTERGSSRVGRLPMSAGAEAPEPQIR